MADVYATYQDYVTYTGDTTTSQERVEAMLASQSAKLRALTRMSNGQALDDDQALLAKELVVDSCRKALVPATLDGFGSPLTGATSASFSANGFQQSINLSNPSGAAYFDRSTLSALVRLLGGSQRIGTISPRIG